MTKLKTVSKESLNLRQVDLSPIPVEHHKRFLNPGEIEVLAALARLANKGNPQRMVEFGCQNGRTAAALLHNIRSINRYYGIDVPVGYATECAVQRKEVPAKPGELAMADPRFVLLLAGAGSHSLQSHDLTDIDVVFIDGDHSVRGVDNDYALALCWCRPGAVIIFHDYHDLGTVGVREAVEAHADAGEEILHVAGTWLAFQKLP